MSLFVYIWKMISSTFGCSPQKSGFALRRTNLSRSNSTIWKGPLPMTEGRFWNFREISPTDILLQMCLGTIRHEGEIREDARERLGTA